MGTHDFSGGPDHPQPARTIDNAAPPAVRNQLIDVAFSVAQHNEGHPTEAQLHQAIGHSLGVQAAGNPMSPRRTQAAGFLAATEWRRVYDVVLRLVPDFKAAGTFAEYRDGVNAVFAANGIAWDLDENGHFARVLPAAVQAVLSAAIQELGAPEYTAALALFDSAHAAYNDVPRRDREACGNAFDAMESVAKVKHNRPNDTFGQVVAHVVAHAPGSYNAEIVGVLQRINALRNANFGHGMAVPFTLAPAEVDFTYLTCVAGILLFARTP